MKTICADAPPKSNEPMVVAEVGDLSGFRLPIK